MFFMIFHGELGWDTYMILTGFDGKPVDGNRYQQPLGLIWNVNEYTQYLQGFKHKKHLRFNNKIYDIHKVYNTHVENLCVCMCIYTLNGRHIFFNT
jgi:hypothetical protein